MKPSTGVTTNNFQMSNSKNKKSSRDREKRKSNATNEKIEQQLEKGSPVKESSSRKYAGIGAESIVTYAEHVFCNETLPKKLCEGLAEDISYKLRYIIHDSLIKARISGRNYIKPSDVNASLESLNVDKVFGGSHTPNWIFMGEHNIHYLDDHIVNLIDLSEQENSYVQPSDVIVTKEWLIPADVKKQLKTYFETICASIATNEQEMKQAALKDLRTNNYIGPIVEWFYNFGYLLLSKDNTYDCLTLNALDLINSLECNSIAPQIVPEKQISLIVRLILQRLLRSEIAIEVLKPMCQTLALLCNRVPIREMVMLKLLKEIPETKKDYLESRRIFIINELGRDAIYELLEPNFDYYLCRIENNENSVLTETILNAYYKISNEVNLTTYKKFYEVFGDSLLPSWNLKSNEQKAKRPESNWKNMKFKLLKTQKKVLYFPKLTNKHTLESVFPGYKRCKPRKIIFKNSQSRIKLQNDDELIDDEETSLLSVINALDQKLYVTIRKHSTLYQFNKYTLYREMYQNFQHYAPDIII